MQALLGEDEDAQRHEAHVADRAVRDELLQVRLDQRHDRAVDDCDERQDDDQRRPLHGRVGEERHGEAQQAVAAQLEQDARQDHRAGSRCLDVRVGQPGVEREHGHLDREGEEEAREGEELECRIKAEAAQRLVVEGMVP